MTTSNPDSLETPPEATPGTPVAPKLTVAEMLERDGFAGWREKLLSARSIPLHEDFRDKIAAQFEAFEASQVVSDSIRDVCDEKLTGDDKESGIVSRISEDEFRKLQEGIALKALTDPRYAAELKKDLEALKTNPAAIATNEAQLIALQQKVGGAADLAAQLKKAETRKAEVAALIQKGNEVPTLRFFERIRFARKYNTDFDAEIKKLDENKKKLDETLSALRDKMNAEGGKSIHPNTVLAFNGEQAKQFLDANFDNLTETQRQYLRVAADRVEFLRVEEPKRTQLERFRDIKKGEKEVLQLRGAVKTKYDLPFDVDWNIQLQELEREIAELGPKVAEAGTVEAQMATLKTETERLKKDIQGRRQKVFDSIPNSAEIRSRAAGEIHAQLKEALTSTDLGALDLAVERVSHFEELARTGGVKSNYLNGLFPAGMSLDKYKTDVTAQIKDVVIDMVSDTLDGMYPGEKYSAFKRDLDDLITRGTKKLGFDSEAKSRDFFLALLEEQKLKAAKTPGTGKASNLEYLILQLRRGKRA